MPSFVKQRLIIGAALASLILLVNLCFGQALDRTHVNYRNPLQHGATCDATTLNAAITAIGTNKETLFITKTDRSKTNCTWTLAANVTTDVGTVVYIPAGTIISVSSGITLTFNGPVQIDDIESLQGAGTYVFNYPTTNTIASFISSGCNPTVPSSSLTFAAFACEGTVAVGGISFPVTQASNAVTLSGGDGNFWLALDFSKTRTVAGWTRQTGTHYLWRLSADRPAEPVGTAIFQLTTVSGAVIATTLDLRKPASYVRSGVYDPTDVLYGAKGDGTTDDSTALQNTIAATCGPGTLTVKAGSRGKMRIPQGVYKTTAQLDIPPACFGEFYGDSVKGTYIYQQSGSGSALRIRGSLCTTCGSVAPRTTGNNDAAVYLHDISLGSTVGHGLSLVNAYETIVDRVHTFSAGVASNFIDLDGVSTFTGNDLRTNGNADFPAEWISTLLAGRTQGLNGIYITSRVAAGSYNVSGQITLNRPRIEGQQTQHAILVTMDAAADFTIYPVIINDPDLIVRATYAGISVERAIVVVNGGYCEMLSGNGDAVRVNTVNGIDNAAYVYDMISNDSCDLNYNGNGVNAGSLIARGGRYRTWLSSNSSYHLFHMEGVRFTTQSTSPYANYTAGEHTTLLNNFISIANTVYSVDSFLDLANDTDNVISRLTYAASSAAGPIFQCRKARGSLTGRTAVLVNDEVCGFYFMGFSNSDYRNVASIVPSITAVSASNLTGQVDFNVFDVGVARRTLRLKPKSVEIYNCVFADLGVVDNGNFCYCTDCTRADPCAALGGGAWAFRDLATWKCNAMP